MSETITTDYERLADLDPFLQRFLWALCQKSTEKCFLTVGIVQMRNLELN